MVPMIEKTLTHAIRRSVRPPVVANCHRADGPTRDWMKRAEWGPRFPLSLWEGVSGRSRKDSILRPLPPTPSHKGRGRPCFLSGPEGAEAIWFRRAHRRLRASLSEIASSPHASLAVLAMTWGRHDSRSLDGNISRRNARFICLMVGHPCLYWGQAAKTWVAATSAAMTHGAHASIFSLASIRWLVKVLRILLAHAASCCSTSPARYRLPQIRTRAASGSRPTARKASATCGPGRAIPPEAATISSTGRASC
jgi:hypothetical protein